MGAVGQRFCACAAFKTTIDELQYSYQSTMELIYVRIEGITKQKVNFKIKKLTEKDKL